jgi:hypothetical protein
MTYHEGFSDSLRSVASRKGLSQNLISTVYDKKYGILMRVFGQSEIICTCFFRLFYFRMGGKPCLQMPPQFSTQHDRMQEIVQLLRDESAACGESPGTALKLCLCSILPVRICHPRAALDYVKPNGEHERPGDIIK